MEPNIDLVVLGIIAGLNDHSESVRHQSSSEISRIENLPGALPAVLAALNDSSEEVRLGAIELLSHVSKSFLREAGAALVPHLIRALGERDKYGMATRNFEVRYIVIHIADVPGVLPAVIDALNSPIEADRLAALDIAEGMMNTGSINEAIPNVIELTKDKSLPVRYKTFYLLEDIGPEQGVIPALILGLQQKDTRMIAASVLGSPRFNRGSLVTGVEDAIPPLIRMLKDKDPYVRSIAEKALASIGPSGKSAIPVLMKVLRRAQQIGTSERVHIIEAIGSMGPTPHVINALIDSFKIVGGSAYSPSGRALAKVGPNSLVVQRLIEALAHRDHRIRMVSADTLAQLGPRSVEAVPILAGVLEHETYFKVLNNACWALQEIGSGAEAAVPQLLDIAGRDDYILGRRSTGVRGFVRRIVLRKLLFYKDENKRPWSCPTVDNQTPQSLAYTLKELRLDASAAVVVITDDPCAIRTATHIFRTLGEDLSNSYRARLLKSRVPARFARIKEMLNRPTRLPLDDSTMGYPPQYYCSICEVKFEDYDPRSFTNDFASKYPYLVCRQCALRALTEAGDMPEHDSDLDNGDNPVFIDGIKCWRRYKFGGFITMRDVFDCQSMGEFYRKVGMGPFNTVTNPSVL